MNVILSVSWLLGLLGAVGIVAFCLQLVNFALASRRTPLADLHTQRCGPIELA